MQISTILPGKASLDGQKLYASRFRCSPEKRRRRQIGRDLPHLGHFCSGLDSGSFSSSASILFPFYQQQSQSEYGAPTCCLATFVRTSSKNFRDEIDDKNICKILGCSMNHFILLLSSYKRAVEKVCELSQIKKLLVSMA